MNTAAIVIFISLLIIGFAAYIFLLVFYPEWVGITGADAAKRMREEHQEGSTVDDSDLFSSK